MEFEAFPKIPRYRRPIVITEKLDGTNAQVAIEIVPNEWVDANYILSTLVVNGVKYNIYAGSRNRWLHADDDNYGFAKWVIDNQFELVEGLGEGRHFGEWWGQGIQRGYGLDHKRFSLFNTGRWLGNPDKPECCHVVPVLFAGDHANFVTESALELLYEEGSQAAPGFMNPEGIVVYHTAGRNLYKVTLDGDAAKGE